jgi:RNA polymerase sigma-70 factor (ECF subfamily)
VKLEKAKGTGPPDDQAARRVFGASPPVADKAGGGVTGATREAPIGRTASTARRASGDAAAVLMAERRRGTTSDSNPDSGMSPDRLEPPAEEVAGVANQGRVSARGRTVARIPPRDVSGARSSINPLSTNGEAIAALGARSLSGIMDEAALIRAAQAGDQSAFEQLVQTYDQSVLRLAMNLVRSPEDASDIYQEAFLRVYRNLHSFRFDCSFHTWLYRIVTNLCVDHIRKRKVRKEEPTVVATGDGQLDRMDAVHEERAEVNPERRLMSHQLSSRIREILGQLTPRERMVFELRHYQGMRLRAIGEVLGTTEEAAKNCLFRATQKMRAALGDFL